MGMVGSDDMDPFGGNFGLFSGLYMFVTGSAKGQTLGDCLEEP